MKKLFTQLLTRTLYQLQLLPYSSKDDLRAKLLKTLEHGTSQSGEEEKQRLSEMHRRLSIGAMLLLKRMLDSHKARIGQGVDPNPWHTSFPVDPKFELPVTGNWTRFAYELTSNGLARYEYGDYDASKNGIEWAIHPTKLGERYLKSEYFLRFFYRREEIPPLIETL